MPRLGHKLKHGRTKPLPDHDRAVPPPASLIVPEVVLECPGDATRTKLDLPTSRLISVHTWWPRRFMPTQRRSLKNAKDVAPNFVTAHIRTAGT
jgi:hypothetical protein